MVVKEEDLIETKPLVGENVSIATKSKYPQSPTVLELPDTPSGKLSKKAQHPHLQVCLDLAIDKTFEYIFFTNAFPLLPEKKRCYRKVLIDAAEEKGYTEIHEKLEKDKEYMKWLTTIVSVPLHLL